MKNENVLKLTRNGISYFEHIKNTNPIGEIGVLDLYTMIKEPFLKDEIENVRLFQTKDERSQAKLALPAVTLSGTFTARKGSALEAHSGLIQIDIDNVSDEIFDSTFEKLKGDPFSLMAFRSPSGTGIKLVVQILPQVETHNQQFNALEKYYKDKYDVEIDPAVKDVSRAMLLSYDPNAYLNLSAKLFEEVLVPEVKKQTSQKSISQRRPISYTTNTYELVENITHAIEDAHIDITEGYFNWIRLGFALVNCLGEGGRDFFHRISGFNPTYNFKKADDQYTKLLQSDGRGVTIATLVFVARQHGISTHPIEQKATIPAQTHPTNERLEKELKALRLEIANNNNIPAYYVFYNSVLMDLIKFRPKNMEELETIKGLGPFKLSHFGNEILKILNPSYVFA